MKVIKKEKNPKKNELTFYHFVTMSAAEKTYAHERMYHNIPENLINLSSYKL